MNFDALHKAKTLFSQIGDFYFKWNAEPESISHDLYEHPWTKRRINKNQNIRNKAQQTGPMLSTLSSMRSYGDVKIEIWQIQNKVAQNISDYRLSGLDVLDYVYRSRILPLRDEVFAVFSDELIRVDHEAQERSRVNWCKEFDGILNAVSQEITKSIANPEEWDELLGDEDWPDIGRALRDLATNDIEPLIKQYKQVVEKYLPNLPTQVNRYKDKKLAPTTFEELFVKLEDLKPCLDALRLVRRDVPVVSDTRMWQNRSGSKAVLAAWIRRMEECRKVHFIADKKLLVPLLNTYFPGLNLGADARTLKDPDANIVREFAALILP